MGLLSWFTGKDDIDDLRKQFEAGRQQRLQRLLAEGKDKDRRHAKEEIGEIRHRLTLTRQRRLDPGNCVTEQDVRRRLDEFLAEIDKGASTGYTVLQALKYERFIRASFVRADIMKQYLDLSLAKKLLPGLTQNHVDSLLSEVSDAYIKQRITSDQALKKWDEIVTMLAEVALKNAEAQRIALRNAEAQKEAEHLDKLRRALEDEQPAESLYEKQLAVEDAGEEPTTRFMDIFVPNENRESA